MMTRTDQFKMDSHYRGSPIVIVCANSSIDTLTMDYSFGGRPIIAAPAQKIKAINSTQWETIGKIGGVDIGNINKINSTNTT